jgi:hypothetical protein
LKTATELLEDELWKTTHPQALFEVSRSIDWPDWWLPYEFCRFFKNHTCPHLLLYIAVNLGDREDDSSVDYALLSTGCITFKTDEKHAETAHWWSRWHVYMYELRKDDGSLCVDEPQTRWKSEDGFEKPPAGIVRVTTFAYPLVEITDSEALKEKIVQPLLKVVEKEVRVANQQKAR